MASPTSTAISRTAGRRHRRRSAGKVDISQNLFTEFVDTRQRGLFYDLVGYDAIIRNGWADLVVVAPQRLDASLPRYAEEGVDQCSGLSRMVNRDDDVVVAVFVGGRAAFLDGKPTDLPGKQRTDRFLRAAHKAPAPALEGELADVS